MILDGDCPWNQPGNPIFVPQKVPTQVVTEAELLHKVPVPLRLAKNGSKSANRTGEHENLLQSEFHMIMENSQIMNDLPFIYWKW